ncbi:MAG: RagB/SusD family nutrient uptake outer membrane protein [Bacteroidales bacterium]
MKKYISILYICLFLLTSCNKWLDVRPESEVDLEKLLQTEAGFMEALNGIYTNCNTPSAYGELICGFPDYLAGNYSQNPAGGLSNNEYKPFFTFDFDDNSAISKTEMIWGSLYKAIAQCNIILERIDSKKSIFSENNYKIIKGEALALRGFLYFDLLRLFAPSFTSKPAAKAIPYKTTFSLKPGDQLTVQELLTKIVEDLNSGKELLKGVDPITMASYVVGYPQIDEDESTSLTNETPGKDIFLNTRRDRMNYYAVCGELARVYLYMNDKVKALQNSKEVIDSQKFPWATKERITTSDLTLKDRIFYTEIIFGLYAPPLATNLATKFENGEQGMFTNQVYFNNAFETGSGGPGGTDVRYANLYMQYSGGSSMLVYKYHTDDDLYMYELRLPVIRLSEMYYIAAESSYDTDPANAWNLLNSVRFQRGIPATFSGDKTTFMSELQKEYRKEFFAEGQLFYFFKRLNLPVSAINGSVYPASDQTFVLPVPDAEIQYGNFTL